MKKIFLLFVSFAIPQSVSASRRNLQYQKNAEPLVNARYEYGYTKRYKEAEKNKLRQAPPKRYKYIKKRAFSLHKNDGKLIIFLCKPQEVVVNLTSEEFVLEGHTETIDEDRMLRIEQQTGCCGKKYTMQFMNNAPGKKVFIAHVGTVGNETNGEIHYAVRLIT